MAKAQECPYLMDLDGKKIEVTWITETNSEFSERGTVVGIPKYKLLGSWPSYDPDLAERSNAGYENRLRAEYEAKLTEMEHVVVPHGSGSSQSKSFCSYSHRNACQKCLIDFVREKVIGEFELGSRKFNFGHSILYSNLTNKSTLNIEKIIYRILAPLTSEAIEYERGLILEQFNNIINREITEGLEEELEKEEKRIMQKREEYLKKSFRRRANYVISRVFGLPPKLPEDLVFDESKIKENLKWKLENKYNKLKLERIEKLKKQIIKEFHEKLREYPSILKPRQV